MKCVFTTEVPFDCAQGRLDREKFLDLCFAYYGFSPWLCASVVNNFS